MSSNKLITFESWRPGVRIFPFKLIKFYHFSFPNDEDLRELEFFIA